MSDRSPDLLTPSLRTCVGCRRTERPEVLLRVVLGTQADPDSDRETYEAVPDPRRRLPGRGAWIHRTVRCVGDAERRQGFRRGFRVRGQVDTHRLQLFVAETTDERAGDRS
ncbi:YlxR family protein [Nakamurella sp. A5-74]|uniref:YlxR family protein n=1 Tax=Nakamurella sp. A5-74 TaxID=3158264 RepID=A0AAU8DJ07_9ACTN